MEKSLSAFALITLLAAGSVFCAPLSSAQEAAEPGIEMREQARRRMALRDAMQQLQEARLAYASKRYTEAVEHYRNALSVLPKAPYTQQQEKFIRDSLSDALIASAIDYRSVGRTEEAIEFLREALRQSPENKRAQQELVYTEDPVRTNPALSPQHIGDVEEVTRLLTLAEGYFNLGKYDDAIRTYQAVIQYDQYNIAARRGIEAASRAKSRAHVSAHDASRAIKLADVDELWDTVSKDADTPITPVTEVTPVGEGTPDDIAIESSHASALSSMSIPGISLENAGIDEVIEILGNYIKRFESQGTQSQRHINVATDFGSADPEDVRKMKEKRITLSLSEVTLRDVVDEVARQFDLEYYFDPMGLKFALPGQGRLVERVYTGVAPHVFDNSGGSGEDDEDGEDESFASGKLRVGKIDPVAALKSAGVTFPKGAYAAYHASSRTLRVRNTQNNIERISEIVHNMPTKEWIVVLNVMVVEVSQDDLEDLGFDWVFNMKLTPELFSTGGVEQRTDDPYTAVGMPLTENQKRVPSRMAPLATSGLRSLHQASDGGDFSQLITMGSARNYSLRDTNADRSPNIFGIRGVWNQADVTMVMRGLSQKKGVDVMSNPQLIFDPNIEEAVTFANVREMFIPQSYDPPEISQRSSSNVNVNVNGGNNGLNVNVGTSFGGGMAIAVGAQPTDFVRYGLDEDNMGGIGTILRVHKAEPSPDGRSVRMAITTVVNDFEGFIDWGSAIYAAMWNDNELTRVYLTPNHIFQPIFKRYMTNTDITIANGAVLVMGGMKDARMVRYEDKVPVLGDLPLVGRLFRSEGEKTTRRALMIFAKVNIIDPTGQDIRGESEPPANSPM